jgi:hypothetical protein
MERARPRHPYVPGFFVGWDNTARRGPKAIVIVRSNPDSFAKGLRRVLRSVRDEPADRRLVFINAWNEWAEAMCLEPSREHGRGFLEAVRRELAHDVASPSDL